MFTLRTDTDEINRKTPIMPYCRMYGTVLHLFKGGFAVAFKAQIIADCAKITPKVIQKVLKGTQYEQYDANEVRQIILDKMWEKYAHHTSAQVLYAKVFDNELVGVKHAN